MCFLGILIRGNIWLWKLCIWLVGARSDHFLWQSDVGYMIRLLFVVLRPNDESPSLCFPKLSGSWPFLIGIVRNHANLQQFEKPWLWSVGPNHWVIQKKVNFDFVLYEVVGRRCKDVVVLICKENVRPVVWLNGFFVLFTNFVIAFLLLDRARSSFNTVLLHNTLLHWVLLGKSVLGLVIIRTGSVAHHIFTQLVLKCDSANRFEGARIGQRILFLSNLTILLLLLKRCVRLWMINSGFLLWRTGFIGAWALVWLDVT